MTTLELLKAAKKAAPELALLSTEQKNQALLAMADALEGNMDSILNANAEDVDAARGVISDVMIDRLALTKARILAMAKGIREVVELTDPIGDVLGETVRADGLRIT